MITLQRRISVNGDPSQTGVKSIAVAIDVPIFAFEHADDSDAIIRRDTSGTAVAFTQPVDRPTYRVAISEPFADGVDGAVIEGLADRSRP